MGIGIAQRLSGGERLDGRIDIAAMLGTDCRVLSRAFDEYLEKHPNNPPAQLHYLFHAYCGEYHFPKHWPEWSKQGLAGEEHFSSQRYLLHYYRGCRHEWWWFARSYFVTFPTIVKEPPYADIAKTLCTAFKKVLDYWSHGCHHGPPCPLLTMLNNVGAFVNEAFAKSKNASVKAWLVQLCNDLTEKFGFIADACADIRVPELTSGPPLDSDLPFMINVSFRCFTL